MNIDAGYSDENQIECSEENKIIDVDENEREINTMSDNSVTLQNQTSLYSTNDQNYNITKESESETELSTTDTLPKTRIIRHNSILQGMKFARDKNDNIGYGRAADFVGRERKFSLDHSLLTHNKEYLSQSEVDLHAMGKLPLDRKASFFRKKMESFFNNTSEIFKKHTLEKQARQRRESKSVSLQSLNEEITNKKKDLESSTMSLQSTSTLEHSRSQAGSVNQIMPPEQEGTLTGSQPLIPPSALGDLSNSVHSLNEAYLTESTLGSRAISMSSGLDSKQGTRRGKSSRANRVTWIANEGLSNYIRRMIQDEKKKTEIQGSYSHSDVSKIAENERCSFTKQDGRRLSYQRAISGEDPMRHHDFARRRNVIHEHREAHYELSNLLAEFSKNGVPPLKGFSIANIGKASAYLRWAEHSQNLEEIYDWKKLNPNEEARQAVLRELISTEVNYIRHLIAIVEIFIAAAHALQDEGKLLELDTERLFSNIPDILNASLHFWELTIYPMLADAVRKEAPFNPELMSSGFCRFHELFQPYEKYVNDQSKALSYLRSLSNNTEFQIYLSWCHSQKSCNRLQLSDILVKPMQRLTKYSLILHRIIAHTEAEPERTSLVVMESYAKNYVLDLNRSIRQREELEKLDALANSIDCYEIDFKDDDMDRYFRLYSQVNLKVPMINCLPCHSRTLIHQGDVRFKDNLKEMDVRAFLFTDMLLICKKLSKGSTYPYKIVRPKYMVDKMIYFSKYHPRNSKDIVQLIFVMVDDVGSAYHSFSFLESSKDSSQGTLKLWEQKIREAKLTYDLGVWFAKNPSGDLSEVDMDSSSDYAISSSNNIKVGVKQSSDDLNIEREARERVATMLHRSLAASTEYDLSQGSLTMDSFEGEASGGSGTRVHSWRHPLTRNSTGGSSRNSRLSSFHQSASATSHDEPHAAPYKYNYPAGSSVEHVIPPIYPDEACTSITVNVVSESESETAVPHQTVQRSPHKMVLRSVSASHHTLRVQPPSGVLALVHSLPDLTVEPKPTSAGLSHSPPSASEKLYQSHQELLQRNRLSATPHHQYLSPDQRGISYPPPSPTRGSLKRGLAFSYSFKNPPLSKMGHVNSQTQSQFESPSQQAKSDKGAVNPVLVASVSVEKMEKTSKHVNNR